MEASDKYPTIITQRDSGGAGKEKAMWGQRWGHLTMLGSLEKPLKGCDIKDATRMQIWQVKRGREVCFRWKQQHLQVPETERSALPRGFLNLSGIPGMAGSPWKTGEPPGPLSQMGGGGLASRCSQCLKSPLWFPFALPTLSCFHYNPIVRL